MHESNLSLMLQMEMFLFSWTEKLSRTWDRKIKKYKTKDFV